MRLIFIPCILVFLLACSTGAKQKNILETCVYTQEDKEIINQILSIFSEEQNSPTSLLVVKVGMFFKETPYVAHTLEGEKEQLVVNLRELDCTTFAENCLAIANTIKSKNASFEQFTSELQKIRYRNGKLTDYTSRLHYFSDWIFDNDQKRLAKSVSKEIAEIPYPNHLNFMSTHPNSYNHLKNDSTLIPLIARQEKVISSRETYFIPKEKIAQFENKLLDGDILGITTSIAGLDISHVGIVIKKAGRTHLMHASSLAKKVVISDETLEEYLLNSKSASGIMVSRPL